MVHMWCSCFCEDSFTTMKMLGLDVLAPKYSYSRFLRKESFQNIRNQSDRIGPLLSIYFIFDGNVVYAIALEQFFSLPPYAIIERWNGC